MFGKKKNTYDYNNYNGYDNNGYGSYGGYGEDLYGGYGYDTTIKQKQTSFNVVMLVLSIVGTVIFYLVGEALQNLMAENVPGPVFIGIYFLVFGIILAIALFLSHLINGTSPENGNPLYILITLGILLIGGMLFEFLYELGGKEVQVIETDCIFIIDNSGSMEANDPNQVRIRALEEIVNEKGSDFKYAVYSLGSEVGMIRQMAPASEGTGTLMRDPNGGTPIVGTLTQIQNDIENGVLSISGNTRIIMLTDGGATDNGFLLHTPINKPLKYFAKHNIVINTVGLGDVDNNLMQKIADKTGGVFIMADDITKLTDAMKDAARISADRNLLSYRPNVGMDWLYAFMRILFIAVLGLSFLPLKLALTGNVESESMVLVFVVAGSIIAALFMELGINLIGFSPAIMRLISVILIGMTPSYLVSISSVVPWDNGGMVV